MKRILFEVGKWSLYLHRDARGLPSAAEGDAAMERLGDELFERLFTGDAEPTQDPEKDEDTKNWAQNVHNNCDQLPSFQRLCDEVRGDAYSSAVAVEKLLEEIKPPPEPSQPEPSLKEFRRMVNRGSEAASKAVEESRQTTEGLQGISWGSSTQPGGKTDAGSIRALRDRLKNSSRLRQIAALAGRFKRITQAKKRTRTRHGCDELADVEQGAELERLLPAELLKMHHPGLRMAFLRDLTERRCMQYQLRGKEPLGKGPLVVCLDKSGSMEGEKDIWASAVALTLLDVAQRERRTFALLCFDGTVRYETVVKPDEKLPEAGLFVGCGGGTSISSVLSRSLELVQQNKSTLGKADVVLVTDGGSDSTPAPTLRQAAQEQSTVILGVGIGVGRDMLEPWADHIQLVSRTDELGSSVSDSLAGL